MRNYELHLNEISRSRYNLQSYTTNVCGTVQQENGKTKQSTQFNIIANAVITTIKI